MIEQHLVNVLANIHGRAEENIANRCVFLAMNTVIANSFLESVGVEHKCLSSDSIFEYGEDLRNKATLSMLLCPTKPETETLVKTSRWNKLKGLLFCDIQLHKRRKMEDEKDG